jgi:hypothetical protein
MLVRPVQAFFAVGRHIAVDRRTDKGPLMGEARPKEGHNAAGRPAVQASSHDFRSRHVKEAVDEYHWAEEAVLDNHYAADSP